MLEKRMLIVYNLCVLKEKCIKNKEKAQNITKVESCIIREETQNEKKRKRRNRCGCKRERERESRRVKKNCSFLDVQKAELTEYIIGRTGYKKKLKEANFTDDYKESFKEKNSRKIRYESKIAEEDFFRDVDAELRRAETFTENSLSFLSALNEESNRGKLRKDECKQGYKLKNEKHGTWVGKKWHTMIVSSKEKFASERGITLLALILTVVIMLILAAVTINVTLGDGGLVDQAKHAAEQTANATKSEQEQIDDLVSQINAIIGGNGDSGEVTNSTPGEDTNQIEETNTIDPEPEPPAPLPDNTISIGQPQWQGDGTANVTVSTTEEGVTIEYQIGGTDEGSWIPVEGGTITGIENGQTVYVRITDGEQANNPQETTVQDITNPTVTVSAQGSPSTNSITVTALASDNESGMVASPTYTFQYKTSGQGSYTTPSDASNISSATYTFTGLTQGTTYDIQVIVNGDNAGRSGTGTTQATTNTVPGADEGLQTGTIIASPVTWSNYKASTTLTTNETGFQIQYQVNGVIEGSWSAAANSPVIVSNLNHNDTVYVRLTDGTNAGDYAAINILDGIPPTVSVEVGDVTDTTIAVTVSATDNESGLADSNAYRYYLNNEEAPRATSSSNTYTYTGLTGSTDYTIKVEVVDKGNNPGTGTASATTETPPISEDETQVANYADVDGNGSVDGVIYADLTIGGSGEWNPGDNSWASSNKTGVYTIPKESNFKKYRVIQESYTGSFGTGQVIAPVNGSSGNERFYVMALTDVDGKQNGATYQFWSSSGTSVVTSTDFGTGKTNTAAMIAKSGSSSYLWEISAVQNGTWNGSSGWYVPSRSEWAAFAGELDITGGNYPSKGLSDWYWSSSQYDTSGAWCASFFDLHIYSSSVNGNSYVRLGTTF